MRAQIESKLKSLKSDDQLIHAEGVDALDLPELIQACQSRGIRTIGVSPSRLRSELRQWLELHLTYQIPGSLVILSRAFMMSERIPKDMDEALDGSAQALQAALASMPNQVVNEASLQFAESAGTVLSPFLYQVNIPLLFCNLGNCETKAWCSTRTRRVDCRRT